MAKVSIGLRGWRFDEDVVFDADGALKPLREMPPDERERIARLAALVANPCDACWLEHHDEDPSRARSARVVYGEPLGEVLLCNRHERDFVYWFHEEGGTAFAGDRLMQNAFHQWWADGGRAPDDYPAPEHEDTDPDSLPIADPNQKLPSLEEELSNMSDEELEELDIDLSDLELDR